MSTKNQTTSPKKQNIEWQLLLSIREIIFSLNKENIKKSANLLFSKSVNKCTYSFSLIVSQMIYAFYETIIGNIDFIFDFLKEIKTYEENNNKTKIFELFTQHVLNNDATYLLYNMVENHLLDPSILEKQKNKNNEIQQTEDEIALKNKLIKEGVNPDEIATIIRNDEIEKLQEITSQSNFNYSQQIVSTIYERYSFIKQTDVTLIDYAAFFGATKCFKLLLMNEANIENAGMFAVAGGNLEIVHLCEQNHSTFKGAYETVIRFNRNDIFKYLYENKIGDIPNLTNLGRNCVLYHNYEILTFLYKEGMKINDNIINEAALKGNIFLVKYFLKRIQIPKDILFASVKSENIELIKFVLEHDEIDVNEQDIN